MFLNCINFIILHLSDKMTHAVIFKHQHTLRNNFISLNLSQCVFIFGFDEIPLALEGIQKDAVLLNLARGRP